MLDVEIVAPDPVYPILRNNKRAYVWETRAYLAYAGNRRLLRVSPGGDVDDLYHAVAPWSPYR